MGSVAERKYNERMKKAIDNGYKGEVFSWEEVRPKTKAERAIQSRKHEETMRLCEEIARNYKTPAQLGMEAIQTAYQERINARANELVGLF